MLAHLNSGNCQRNAALGVDLAEGRYAEFID
jgi:hypothetical protein